MCRRPGTPACSHEGLRPTTLLRAHGGTKLATTTARAGTLGVLVFSLALLVPALSPLAAPVSQRPDAVLEEEGADGPDWLTDQLEERLRSGQAVPVAEIDSFPVPAEAYTDEDDYQPPRPYDGIRPGTPLGFTQFSCTANFVFEAPGEDRLGIGTAGHCADLASPQQALYVSGDPPTLKVDEIGITVLSRADGIGSDFALIEVDEDFHPLVGSAIAEIDGPCGYRSARDLADGPEGMQYYGHGIGTGVGGQARHGAIVDHNETEIEYARFPAGSFGDSGSPVRFTNGPNGSTDLAAAGINTHGLGNLGWGTSLPGIFKIIEADGSAGWQLVDSPNCDDLAELIPSPESPMTDPGQIPDVGSIELLRSQASTEPVPVAG